VKCAASAVAAKASSSAKGATLPRVMDSSNTTIPRLRSRQAIAVRVKGAQARQVHRCVARAIHLVNANAGFVSGLRTSHIVISASARLTISKRCDVGTG
jgi:hypothetical protein